MKRKNLVPFTAAILIACVSCQTYTVPGDFPDIQTALDGVPEFSTIVLADGTYYENLVWPQKTGIVLRSESGSPEHCIIDGSGAPEPVLLMAATLNVDLVLDGVMFQGGTGVVNEKAGGIHLTVADGVYVNLHALIRNCVISGNSEGGLFFGHPEGVGSSLVLEDSHINDTSVSDMFGVLMIFGSATLLRNEIQGNEGYGMLFFSEVPAYLFMTGNIVAENECAGDMGVGIWVGGEYTVDIRENYILDISGKNVSMGSAIGSDHPIFGVSSAVGGQIEGNWIYQTGELPAVVGIQVYEPATAPPFLSIDGNWIHHNQGKIYSFWRGVGICVGELFDDAPLFQASGDVTIINNMIYRNDVGIMVNNAEDGVTSVINNTVVYSDFVGIGALQGSKEPSVYNSIVGNWGSEPPLAGDLLGVTKVKFSDIEQQTIGEGNISANPLFVDPANNDFHLMLGSPCIDSGTSEIPIGVASDSGVPDGDIDGELRDREKPDIGADEFLAESNGCERC